MTRPRSRAELSELNEVIKEALPEGFSFDLINTEDESDVPETLHATKGTVYPKEMRYTCEVRYITIQRMKRGKPYKIIVE